MPLFSALASLALVLAQTPAYVPERVYDTQKRTFVDFEVMLAGLAPADVVFVGEQHDDPNTHRLEAAILEGLKRRGITPVVSLEMFERDVQPLLDAYLAGTAGEEDTLMAARPWPRYKTDYRPLVEFAKANGLRVLAANVPRRLAAAVAKGGREALEAMPEADRALAARQLECPTDGYFDRFVKSMGEHPGSDQTPEQKRAMTERYYWSQCVKDETMAESIAAAFEKKSGGPIVHYNGAFHSDFGLGTAERTRRRLPGKTTVVISMLPIANLDALAPSDEDLKRADYLVFTVK